MLTLLSISLIVIRGALGNLEVEGAGQLQEQLRNGKKTPISAKLEEHDFHVPKLPDEKEILIQPSMRKEKDVQKEDYDFHYKENNRNKRQADRKDTDLNLLLNGNEFVPTDAWLYLPIDGEDSHVKTREDISQEKKSLSLNPRGGKRIALYRSNIQRPIRVSFNSWGGKRAFNYPDNGENFLIKRISRLFSDSNTRFGEFGKATRRVPFNSWGGKRSNDKDFNPDGNFKLHMNSQENLNSQLLEDETKENELFEQLTSDKRTKQLRNNKLRVRFNSWGGKRSDNDETATQDMTDQPIEDQLPAPNKRNVRKYVGKFYFKPWSGKTNMKLRNTLTNDHIAPQIEPIKVQQGFFPWGG